MELTINAHNMRLTSSLRTYVEKKIDRLDRYMPNLRDVHVDLAERKARNVNQRQRAQITVRNERGTILRAEESSNDIFAAIDSVVDKIYRQIVRYRGKRKSRRRNGDVDEFAMMEPVPIDSATIEAEPEVTVVRRKQFSLRPMSVDEAGDQMELLGHDFFVFFNQDDDQVNVLYKRKDGNYGLLQPSLT